VKPKRATIVAGATLLGLGGLAAAALTAGGEPAKPVAATAPVEIRTEVIHRTVRRAERRAPRGSTPAVAAGGQARQSPARAVEIPVSATSGPTVTTRQSGSGRGEAEHGDDTRADESRGEADHGDDDHGSADRSSHPDKGRGRDD